MEAEEWSARPLAGFPEYSPRIPNSQRLGAPNRKKLRWLEVCVPESGLGIRSAVGS